MAFGKVLPKYKCEDCVCLDMNPGADVEADKWWASLSPEMKATVYLSRQS